MTNREFERYWLMEVVGRGVSVGAELGGDWPTGGGYDDGEQGVSFMRVNLLPNERLRFVPTIPEGSMATVEIYDGEETLVQSLVPEEEIELPSGERDVTITFTFIGGGEVLGSLLFTGFESSDTTVKGELLKFTTNEGVHILDEEDGHPLFGDTDTFPSAESAFISLQSKLILGNT